jgi:uncharacterized protein
MDVDRIAPLLARLKEHLKPQEIWLFGSRARGTARPDSDWDLLAIVPDDSGVEIFDPMTLWRLLRFDDFGADVVVFPRSEFEEDRTTPNTLPFVVAREGVRIG